MANAESSSSSGVSQLVQKALDLIRPHRPHRLFPLCFVSESTRITAKAIFDLLAQEKEIVQADLDKAKQLLDDSPKGDSRNIFSVVNWDGFTLLQRAVMSNQLPLVKLLIKKGANVNGGICSLPLHLACKLGYVHIAQLLLTHGARADLECTVCYPEHHKLKTYPDQIYCLSYQPVYTPVMHALSGDHEQVLRLLLHHENSRQLVKTDFLLHEACKVGAHECSRYLLQRYSEQMMQENTDGKTPLQISLVTDTESAMFLMDHGAQIKETVFLTESGSTLHELYKSRVTLGLLKATRFALDHGFRSHINVRDQEGNTVLNVLLRHVGRTVNCSIQSDYDHEVEECIKLLLIHGANPNIPNHVGESSLHAALSDTSSRQLYVSRHGQVRRLKPILQEICKSIEILLAYGADGSYRNAPAVSPLFYAIRIFESLQPDMFIVVKVPLKNLLLLVSQANCNVNTTDSYGMTPFLLLLNCGFKWISTNANNVNFCKTIIPFLGDILQHFMKCGLDANTQLSYWTRRMDEAIESTYFKEIILYLNLIVAGNPHFYHQIRCLLLKLVQRGGNPNLLAFTPSYGTPYNVTLTGEPPRDASMSFLLTRALFVQSEQTLPPILDMLLFFSKTLVQSKLTEFVDSIMHFINTDFKSLPLSPAVISHVSVLSTSPRSLKELTRVSIAENLEWKLMKRCPKLPLPKVLRHYLLDFDL